MEKQKYRFRYIQKQGDFHVLRAPIWKTKRRKSLDCLKFRNDVFNWLETNLRANDWKLGTSAPDSHRELSVGVAKTKTGNYLALALRNPADIALFAKEFTVRRTLPDGLI